MPMPEKTAEAPECPVHRLATLMQQYRLLLFKRQDEDGGEVKVKGMHHCPAPVADEVSRLVFMNQKVGRVIDASPLGQLSARELVRGR